MIIDREKLKAWKGYINVESLSRQLARYDDTHLNSNSSNRKIIKSVKGKMATRARTIKGEESSMLSISSQFKLLNWERKLL